MPCTFNDFNDKQEQMGLLKILIESSYEEPSAQTLMWVSSSLSIIKSTKTPLLCLIYSPIKKTDPRAHAAHVNFSLFPPPMRLKFHAVFGSAEGWSDVGAAAKFFTLSPSHHL